MDLDPCRPQGHYDLLVLQDHREQGEGRECHTGKLGAVTKQEKERERESIWGSLGRTTKTHKSPLGHTEDFHLGTQFGGLSFPLKNTD